MAYLMTEPDKSIFYINGKDRYGNEILWTKYPFCPVKRWNGASLQLGVIWYSNKTEVKFANIFMLPKKHSNWDKLDGIEYQTIEELVLEGEWRVD